MTWAFFFSFLIGALSLWGSPTPRCVSDIPDYRETCKQAASDETAFSQFKRNPFYNLMHEYHGAEEGRQYLSFITERYPELLAHVEKFRQNDRIGAPRLFDFANAGLLSPSTLSYVKLAGDLKSHFGDLSGLDIVEIGGGYGGLCKILSDLFSFKSYTLIDLPESIALARRVVEQQGIKNVRFLALNQVKGTEKWDLVISQYSFAEMNRSLQKRLLQKILSKTARGYLLWTHVPRHFRVRPYPKEQLFQAMKDFMIPYSLEKEEPQMGKENFVLTWCKNV